MRVGLEVEIETVLLELGEALLELRARAVVPPVDLGPRGLVVEDPSYRYYLGGGILPPPTGIGCERETLWVLPPLEKKAGGPIGRMEGSGIHLELGQDFI